MSNPLFDMLGGAATGGGLPPILQQFLQFKQGFTGNAQQQVQQLLNSGRISQQQYDQAVQQARQLQQMMQGRK